MEYMIDSNASSNIKIGADGIEDILQCARMILGVIEGEVYLDRKFGISSDAIDEPSNQLNRLHEEIYSKFEMYEPRIEITRIKASSDNLQGKINIVVGVRIKDEYL